MSLTNAALISGGSSLLGGFLQSRSDKKTQALNLEQQRLDRQFQLDFAQQGIRWRVEDAKQAGIHPLYAMGASIPAYSPSAQTVGGNTNAFQGLAKAGQDVGNAVARSQTKGTRELVTMQRLQIVEQSLKNEQLQAQILRDKKAASTPAFPDANQPPGSLEAMGAATPPSVKLVPSEIEASIKGDPGTQAGTIPATRFMRNIDDTYQRVPAEKAKEAMEENMFLTALYNWRTYGIPIFVSGAEGRPPPVPAPKGQEWAYNKIGASWETVPIGSRSTGKRRMKKVMKLQGQKRRSRRNNPDYRPRRR